MIMPDQEHDWLDERLAESPYIADGGFTERVVAQLSQSSLTDAQRARRRILATAGGCSFAVGLLLALIDIPAHASALTPGAFHFTVTDAAVYFSNLIRQPMVLYSSVGAIMLSSLAVLPFLRRWV